MKKLFAAVFVSILFFAAQAQQPQQWKSYVFPDDGFGITLPSQPNPHNDNGDRHIHVYTSQIGKTVVSLRVVSRAMDCQDGLAEMWDKASNPAEKTVKGSLKQLSLPGMQGMEYETELGSGERSLHRFQCADSRKFYMFSAGYQGKQRPPAVTKIIDSFHLVNQAH